MAQQTAMQKLLTNLESIGITIPQGVQMVYLKIEKDQVMNSYNDGYRDGMTDLNSNDKDISEFSNAKLYFDETFKKQ